MLKTAHDALLWHHASYDYLTGLSNRRHFMQQLERSKACAERRHDKFGLLFLDLNGFKKINDTYGHDTGDQLLKTVAARILSAIRVGDLAARFGGDEFVVLVEGVNSRETLNTVAEKVSLKVAGLAEIGPHSVMISASVGSALFPDDGENMLTLFEVADKAMYYNKHHRV
jgi:diguanylate cyclase (GGDEF)-like protein